MTPGTRPLCGLALALGCALGASAQTPAAPSTSACPAALELQASDLYGLWRLSLWPEGSDDTAPHSTGAMLFGPHPEFVDSVRGRLRRSGPGADLEAEVAGDITSDGEFVLDESSDGTSIDAVWSGQPTDCGRRIQGLRRAAEGRPGTGPMLRFLLQRARAGQ